MSTKDNESIVFVNAPIKDSSEDIIGMGVYADKLKNAIDNGAKMIAITSPFGAGKSSLAKLLENNLQEHNEYCVQHVSMWPRLCSSKEDQDGDQVASENDLLSLHGYFLTQMISKISPSKANFAAKRLNGQYGLLRVHAEGLASPLSLIVAVALIVLRFIIVHFSSAEETVLGFTPLIIGNILMATGVLIIAITILNTEILFSSNRSEGQRIITSADIVESYRKYILKSKNDHIIVVVEDLDRTEDTNLVITFLKELRKYYVEDENNKVVFVVNIKPESFLHPSLDSHEADSKESLYSKLFDYTLNLQSINISDYDVILNELILNKQQAISKLLGIENATLEELPELEWIVRGKNISIRTIKDRLNRTFSLFESLKDKFPDSKIELSKCAAASYLVTSFEKEFYKTGDEFFGLLSEAYIRNELSEEIERLMPKASNEYKNAVKQLIEAHLIDDEYHIYYYNYPKDGRIYYSDEIVVRNAILYGEVSETLHDMAEKATDRGSAVFQESFEKVKKLGIPIQDCVFADEIIYKNALKYHPEGVYKWLNQLDYKGTSAAITTSKLISVLSMDKERNVFNSQHAKKYAEIWSEKFSEPDLLRFRQKLCREFSSEILWYKPLFVAPHQIISPDEISLLDLCNAVELTDVKCETLSNEVIDRILDCFKESHADKKEIEAVENLIRSAEKTKKINISAEEYLNYMLIATVIPADFEKSIVGSIKSNQDHFAIYQSVINQTSSPLTSQTMDIICEVNKYNGFSERVSDILFDNERQLQGILIKLAEGYQIAFSSDAIKEIILQESTNIANKFPELFLILRRRIIESGKVTIENYKGLFSENCPVITKEELWLLNKQSIINDLFILKLIAPSKVTAEAGAYIAEFFNRKWHNNTEAYEILALLSNCENSIAHMIFHSFDYINHLQFYRFSAPRKKAITEKYEQILKLGTPMGQIDFMNTVKCIYSQFDNGILPNINGNEKLEEAYCKAVDSANASSITKTTMSNIAGLSYYYPLSEQICERLYEAKYYKDYVVATAMRKNAFILDNSEKTEVLWPTYISIFNSQDPEDVATHMSENIAFLREIMKRKSFEGLSEDARKKLLVIDQNADSLRDLLNYNERFVIDYLSKVAGFTDYFAAEEFVSLVESNRFLGQSEDVYTNTHSKLIDSKLKARYTRAHKRA